MRRLALLVAALAVATSAAEVTATASAPSARPPQLASTERCLNRVERRQLLRFGAADGTRLVGVLLGKGKKGVVLAHQSSGNFCQWFPYARTLAHRGFRVLAFDFRTCGASDIPAVQAKAGRFDLDVVAAVNVLRRRGATSIVLAGGSLGASAVVVVASRLEPQVQGVISLSSPNRRSVSTSSPPPVNCMCPSSSSQQRTMASSPTMLACCTAGHQVRTSS